jgi:hypothetical protein
LIEGARQAVEAAKVSAKISESVPVGSSAVVIPAKAGIHPKTVF